MSDKLQIGAFLKQIRKQKKLSQAKLGKMVGVDISAVSRWEVNRVNPNLDMSAKLAAALEVSLDELCGKKRSETGNLERLAKKASKLNQEKQLALEIVFKAFLEG